MCSNLIAGLLVGFSFAARSFGVPVFALFSVQESRRCIWASLVYMRAAQVKQTTNTNTCMLCSVGRRLSMTAR
jgi:hypothetical protein